MRGACQRVSADDAVVARCVHTPLVPKSTEPEPYQRP